MNVPTHNCVEVPFGSHPAADCACEAGMRADVVRRRRNVYVLAGRRHCR